MKSNLLFFSFVFLLTTPKSNAQKLVAVPYVSGINAPIDLKNCGDDRLFVVERGGKIRIINADGTLRTTAFLDITSKISSGTEGEEGLLGLAFSPNYKTNGKFYVDYTGFISGQLTTFVEQYTVSAGDSNIADASSALTLLTQPQPFTNHNGGNLMFGKDEYLYISFGDGGSGGDPFGNGQNKKTFLGKILRIDVSKSSTAQPYVNPTSNPFYNDTTAGLKKEIWTYGVRNPFRCSVDKLTGDLLIGDVGQNKVEEVDFQKANDIGGRNYGWNIVEGDSCYTGSSCNKSGITMPVYEYFHNGGGGAIIGGYVFRSAQSKSLWGQYLFTDEILKFVDAFTLINGTISGSINHLITAAQAKGNPVSFGEDKYGDQYILFYGNNTVYKLEDTSYLRRPKAYFTAVDAGGNSFLLQGWQGRNLTYQWLKDNVPIQGATFPGYTASTPGSYTFEVTNTLGFKDTSDPFVFGSSVSLLSFTARKLNGGLIRLDWETGAELNITGFTVQRRRDNEPEFSNIGFLTSKSINGFSNNVLAYTLSDSSVSAYKKLFYRLQIEYSNGSAGYSDIRFISADNTRNGFLVFPNPARRQANLFLDEFTQPVVLIVYDNSGRKIAAQKLNQQNNIVSLPAAKGVYILQVSSEHGENKVRKKLVVE